MQSTLNTAGSTGATMPDPDYDASRKLARKISALVIDDGASARDAVIALNFVTEAFLAELLEEEGVPSDPRVN
jgi:hypothetical protein